MIELALFLSLGASAPAIVPMAPPPGPQASVRIRAPLRCDDGSDLYRPDGTPNWDCELSSCSPHELTCWSERLDHCYDDSGDDNGVCSARKVTTCDSRWSCFKLWANCRGGEYGCTQTAWPGCSSGTCTTAGLKSTLPKKGASSSAGGATAPRTEHVAPSGSRLLDSETRSRVESHDV